MWEEEVGRSRKMRGMRLKVKEEVSTGVKGVGRRVDRAGDGGRATSGRVHTGGSNMDDFGQKRTTLRAPLASRAAGSACMQT